jgi:glycosyltransferase involved in cell wall biosynthesis
MNQMSFLPNGVNMMPQASESMKDRKSDSPRILFLANLVVSKGPLELAGAAKLLQERGVDFVMYFVGNPSRQLSQGRFEKLIVNAGLQSQVIYLGPKYGAEKDRIMAESDIFVFPTFYERECFPLVLLEAMSWALPIVSTSEGAIPEIVDDGVTGFLVPARDPNALAEKIEFLITHPEVCDRMGQAGQRKFERSYTLGKFHENLVEVIERITENRVWL